MQFKLLTLSAFAATALGQAQLLSNVPASELTSVIHVLETALPSSLLFEALTNSAAASSEIVAEFQTGTPSWYANLPSDIKSLLPIQTASVPLTTAHLPTANATAIFNNGTASASGHPINSSNGTMHTSSASSSNVLSSITSVVGGGSSSSSAAPSSSGSAAGSSSSGNGAAMPTAAVYGMGAAGLAGLMGVLAL